MCAFCDCNKNIKTTTTYMADCDGVIVIIKNVPCEECEQCGERYYSTDVILRIDAIIESAKKMMQEVAILDYNKAA